jgi:hypothetical protein
MFQPISGHHQVHIWSLKHTEHLKRLKLLKTIMVINRTIYVATGSTTTLMNTVYILHFLYYSKVAIASPPGQVFQFEYDPNLIM